MTARSRVGIAVTVALVAGLAVVGAVRLRARAALPPLPPEPRAAGFIPPVAAQLGEAYVQAVTRPDDATAVGRVGMLLHAYSQPDPAAPWYDRARRLAPREGRWTYLLALVRHASGDNEAALAGLRELLRGQPDYTPARASLGSVLLASGQAEASRQVFAELAAHEPGSRHAHYDLGRALAALGQADLAIPHLERAAAAPPEFAAARYALSLAYRDAGRADAALRQLVLYRQNPGAQLPRNDPLLAEVLALDVGPSAYNRRAIALFAAGRPAEAARELEELTRLDPTDDNAHSDLIDLYASLKQWDRAEAHYRAAVALRPTSRAAHVNWGALLLRQGRFSEAAKVFAQVLELNPDDAMGHVRLGQALEGMEAPGEAMRHYRQAIRIDPGNREARYLLGQRLLATGDAGEALGHLERTLSPIDAQTPRYMRQLGLAYARAGDRERAIHHLREAGRLAREGRQGRMVTRIDADLQGLGAEGPDRR